MAEHTVAGLTRTLDSAPSRPGAWSGPDPGRQLQRSIGNRAALTPDQVVALHQGALDNPRVGPQARPVPEDMLGRANRWGIVIRDSDGHVYE
jgi:hypothetical protein